MQFIFKRIKFYKLYFYFIFSKEHKSYCEEKEKENGKWKLKIT